jgi:hypothetical protein
MINLFFFLKFKAQLRRTRPDLVRLLDESLTRAITDSGGKITGGRSIISAVFNEETLGIWLDMYILIENLKKTIEASKDFYGYSLVISCDPVESPEALCRFMANSSEGVFIDLKAARKFIAYASFEKPSQWLSERKTRKYGSGNYYRIKELKTFKPYANYDLSLQNNVEAILEKEDGKNVLILGPYSSQTRTGILTRCKKITGDFPPLMFCFGSIGLGAIVDAWSLNIRSLQGGESSSKEPSARDPSTDEIDFLWELLFRERIRDEVSDFIVRSVRRFLSLLMDYYFNNAKKRKRTPVLVLENIHLAGKKIADLLLDTISDIGEDNKKKLIVIGTAEEDIPSEKLQQWDFVFNIMRKAESKNQRQEYIPRLTTDLWEIIYAISLFGRFFSPELFQRLFEEEEKNPAMVTRAFSIFHMLGLVDNPKEPWPLNRRFEEHARKVLGDKMAGVKSMVRRRLLSWTARRNINPCFRLLTILASLDGVNQIDDLLLLKSVTSDIVNETISGLELALSNGQLEDLVASQRAAAVRHIFKTSRALYTGSEHDIDQVFLESTVDGFNSKFEEFPVLKAQIIVNLSGFYLGRHDKLLATEKAKEAILLGQSKNSFCLPQGYRLFSLVCLSKQQTAETIEYLGFALANAEKSGNYHEMGISAYYAAAAQFLYGDIYNASRLAQKSIEQSIAAGRPDWADRSRFLEGRLKFELGLYREAHDIFEGLRQKPYGNITAEKDTLLAAWIYRAKIYLLDARISKPDPSGHDADLFEIEAAYLAGDYQRAVALSSTLGNPFSKESFLYTEQPNWSSGFAQCEHLYYTQGEIQDRMICMFHSLSLCHLSAGKTDAVQYIQRILRDEKLCEMDPWDAFYFYAKYLILEQTEASHVDMSTAVSIAFKRLQRRASRIEDVETRRQYLNGPRWNRELSAAAKLFKLI